MKGYQTASTLVEAYRFFYISGLPPELKCKSRGQEQIVNTYEEARAFFMKNGQKDMSITRYYKREENGEYYFLAYRENSPVNCFKVFQNMVGLVSESVNIKDFDAKNWKESTKDEWNFATQVHSGITKAKKLAA